MWEASSAESVDTPYPGANFDDTYLERFVTLVAEEAGVPAGCAYVNLASDIYGFVFGLYVVPDYRRRRIARALMHAVAEELHDQRRDYIVLSVDTPNAPARALYERLGFVDAARTLRARTSDLLD